MTLDTGSWHARIYFWWHRHKYAPSLQGYVQPPSNANLCPYVRAVLIWAPLRAVLGGWLNKRLSQGVWLLLAIIVPELVGYVSFDLKLRVAIVEAVALGGFLFACGVFALLRFYERHQALRACMGVLGKACRRDLAILRAYSQGVHDRVCPEIHFAAEEKEHGAL